MRRTIVVAFLPSLFLVACASGPEARERSVASNPLCLSSEIESSSNARVAAARVQPPECKPSESNVLWTSERDGDDEPIDFRPKHDE